MSRLLFKIIIVIMAFVYLVQAFPKSKSVLQNGGFEDDGYRYWLFKGNSQYSSRSIRSGNKALEISADSSNSSYAYQYLKYAITDFTATLWLYPQSKEYRTSIKMVANWDKSSFDNIISLNFSSDSLLISSFNSLTRVENNLNINSWNKVVIKTDSSGLIKNIYTNDTLTSSIKSNDIIPVSALILGDMDSNANGTVFYDDISITSKVADIIDAKSSFFMNQFSLGKNFVGLSYGMGIAYGFNNHLITLRFIGADEFDIQIVGVHPFEEDTPSEKLRDIGLLYGRYFVDGNSLFSLSAGISYLTGVKRGKLISDHEFEKKDLATLSFPIEIKAIRFSSKSFGLGLTGLANINKNKTIFAGMLGLYFKK
jgi:hypothetical protein